MPMVRRVAKQLLWAAMIGLVVRKLMAAEDPRLRRVGTGTNRLVGGVFGPGEVPAAPSRGRSFARSAAGVAAGAVLTYFLDPFQGAERRMRVKGFVVEHTGGRTNGGADVDEVEREASMSPQVAG